MNIATRLSIGIGCIALLVGTTYGIISLQSTPTPEPIRLGERSHASEPPPEWDIVRTYVTTTYPISEEYFNKNFFFQDLRPAQYIRGAYLGEGEWKRVLDNIIMIDYRFYFTDGAGNEHVTTASTELYPRIYLHEGNVLDSTYIDSLNLLEEYSILHGQWRGYLYDMSQLRHEPTIMITPKEAYKKLKQDKDCPLEDITLDTFLSNIYSWISDDGLLWRYETPQYSCAIQLETGETSGWTHFAD